MANNRFKRVFYLSYYPNIALLDFFIFDCIKINMEGSSFVLREEAEKCLTDISQKILNDKLNKVL